MHRIWLILWWLGLSLGIVLLVGKVITLWIADVAPPPVWRGAWEQSHAPANEGTQTRRYGTRINGNIVIDDETDDNICSRLLVIGGTCKNVPTSMPPQVHCSCPGVGTLVGEPGSEQELLLACIRRQKALHVEEELPQ